MKIYRTKLFLLTSLQAVIFFFLTSGLVSCSLMRAFDEISLTWPRGNLEIFENGETDLWNLTWLSSDGGVRGKQVPGGIPSSICIPREIPIVITATPVMREPYTPFQIKPAGCVLSADIPRNGKITLSWEQGFCAEYLLRLAESGINPGIVNIRRIVETVDTRSKGNPWTLDVSRLSFDLLEGKLWVYSFRQLPFFDVSLQLPQGHWYSEYPPTPVLVSESGVWNGVLTPGLHNFLRMADGMVVSVEVDERADVIIYSGSCQFTGEIP